MSLGKSMILIGVMTGAVAQAEPAAGPPAALFEALSRWDLPGVETLLQQDASLAAARRDDGRSAVMVAAFRIHNKHFVPPSRNEVLQAILARKPKLDFFETCLAGDPADVARQLAADASLVGAWSPNGWTPLHFAAFSGQAEMVRVLLDRGAAIDARAKNKFRNTPLQVALLPGQYDTVKVLLERGADALVRQNLGFAPIHEAASLGRQDLAELLLCHGAEINARANDGRTAVTEAVRGGQKEMAEYLKSKGGKTAEITVDMSASPVE